MSVAVAATDDATHATARQSLVPNRHRCAIDSTRSCHPDGWRWLTPLRSRWAVPAERGSAAVRPLRVPTSGSLRHHFSSITMAVTTPLCFEFEQHSTRTNQRAKRRDGPRAVLCSSAEWRSGTGRRCRELSPLRPAIDSACEQRMCDECVLSFAALSGCASEQALTWRRSSDAAPAGRSDERKDDGQLLRRCTAHAERP